MTIAEDIFVFWRWMTVRAGTNEAVTRAYTSTINKWREKKNAIRDNVVQNEIRRIR